MSVRSDTLKKTSSPVIDITNYWQHYGLHCDPFATQDEEGMYYALSRWEEHLDLLQYLCHYNNVLGVIAGVNGSGKSSLMNQFIAQVGDTMSVCPLTADGTLNTQQIIEAMRHAFHLSRDEGETIEEQLDHLLATIQTSKKICVLVVDNAHLLASETLRTLFYIVSQQSETQKRLHIVLFGEPQLQLSLTRLAHTEGDPELLHPIVLEPFSLEETERYIQHRLQIAGLKGEFPLSSVETARIYKLSEGVPGRINRIARRTLLNALVRQQTEVTESSWQIYKTKVYGGGALFLGFAFLILGLSWMSNSKNVLIPMPQTVVTHNKVEANTVIALKNDDMTTEALKIRAALHPSAPAATPTPAPAEAALVLNGTSDVPVIHAPVAALAPTPVPVAVIPTPASAPVTVAVKVNPAPMAVAPVHVVSAPTPAPAVVAVKVNSAPAVVPAPMPVPAPVTVAVKKVEPQPHIHLLVAHHQTIAQGGYTLQLMGLSQESTIRNMIHAQHLDHKATYYHTLHNGKDFYVMTYGHFKTSGEAMAAAKTLPGFLQHQHPWSKAILQVEKEKHIKV